MGLLIDNENNDHISKHINEMLGLPIDGNVVTGVGSISRPARLCYELLGRSPSEGRFATLRFSWLKANFEHLPSTAIELEVMQAARGYIMHLIGGVLVPDSHSSEFISMPYSVPEIMAVIPSHAYVHSQLWCISAPLINFQTVEWYHGDRVLRQFGCVQYIPTEPGRLPIAVHGMTRRGLHRADWGDVHEEYITMWTNRFGRIPPMDRCLDLRPSPQYLQWYYEKGKPFLFDLHHAPASEVDPEPELHSGSSSYHPDLGGNDYFPGSSAHGYYSDFDIFSPLPHQYSTPSSSYPPLYSAPSGSYPPPYSAPSGSYLPSYSSPPEPYPSPFSSLLDLYPAPFSTPPGPYPAPFSTPPGSSSSVAFESFSTPIHMDE
ncbi:hypothetical protein J1N35_031203 [Gossypium stocksii]|uniref:Aminotransferase-like plant mobile domain-containing protein n=1 Tax=Gossypium stocksii TaxID=47602 RepID=A0A9D3ZTJ8_9ROSI|nr:hypothetical protein J1N35_031203 [Gossypium stocksii]